MSLKHTLQSHYRAAGLPKDGGISDKWVRVKIGPLPLAFPNTNARRRAVPLHDLHHVATGYQTDLRGESELAAWEIAAGCGDHYFAWIVNGLAACMGLVIAPVRTLRAFRVGLGCLSLYDAKLPNRGEFTADLLDLHIDDLRNLLRLESTSH